MKLLSSRNLIFLLLTVPASGLDMSSRAEKFRDILSQINDNSNIKDYALSFSSTVRGAKQIQKEDISPIEKFSACGDATEKMDMPDFKGMDNNMDKYFQDGVCTMDVTDGLVITCDLRKSINKDYTKYAKQCKKRNGKLVNISKDMCMSSEMMESGMMRRKLQESGEDMKIVMNDFPMCIAKECNYESIAVMEGIMHGVINMMGMSCVEENPKSKFFLKKKRKKIKMMSCGNLAKKKPAVIKKVCFSAKHQDYSGGSRALPASQVCKETCKPDLMNAVEEVPSAKFSVMKDNKEVVMTCGELERKTMRKDMKSGPEAMWTCLEGLKDDAHAPSKKKGGKKIGGKKALKKIYGGAQKVCTETCGGIMGEIMGIGEEENGNDY